MIQALTAHDLSANVARAEARPAYKRALAAKLAVFTGTQPPG
jgi:glutathione S-transferase